ncbi:MULTISPECIES: hypothetical protein [unclassified Streptomyces]
MFSTWPSTVRGDSASAAAVSRSRTPRGGWFGVGGGARAQGTARPGLP